jgi:hypothetical protein
MAVVYSIVAGVLTSGTMALSVMRLANEINPDLGVNAECLCILSFLHRLARVAKTNIVSFYALS